MNERIYNTIFVTHSGEVYEAYEIDEEEKTISGYKLFSLICKPNGYRTFKFKDVNIATLRRDING